MVTTDRWGEGTKREARRTAGLFLRGVGFGETVESWRPICLHLRRALTDTEMSMLTAEWLALPARDEFSEEGGMEARL